MTHTLTGKVALVTGGSRGIGRAIAEQLGMDGAFVGVNYTQNEDAAQEVVRTITSSGGEAAAFQADMSRLDHVRRLFDDVQARFGKLDILVNNAGTGRFTPLAEVTEEEFDAQFALNVKGALFAMQEASRRMTQGGRIINISSSITIGGAAGGAVYGGTKGALEQLTLAAAKELGPRGITVNTVSPGATETDLLNAVMPAEAKAERVQASPLKRLGRPQDIASIVAFVASDGGGWLTGQNIRASGGSA